MNFIKIISNFVLNNKKSVLILLALIPIFLFLLSKVKFVDSNLLIIIFSIINFFLFLILATFLIKIFSDKKVKNSQRTPFHFIRNLNLTYNKDFWDEYKSPLKHLIGAEIGVMRGKHASTLLNGYLNIKKLYLIDPWKTYDDIVEQKNFVKNQKFYDECYNFVKNKFSNNKKVEIVREASVIAAKKFDDNFFDFIYIDANHDYEFVLEDLRSWYPKLKKYGVMCGDDYGHPSGNGVIKAVTEFAYEKKIIVSSSIKDKQFWFVKT